MSVSKLLRYGQVFYNWRLMKREALPYLPQDIYLEVTNVCNLKCVFCPQSAPNHHDYVPRTYLTPEACATILANIRRAGVTTGTLHWSLDGEPFMNKRFDELLHVGAAHGFSNMFFATNGTLVTPERITSFPLDGCRYTFTVDYCADAEYFEKVRGLPGSWAVIKKNIENVLADPRLDVTFHLGDISSFSVQDEAERAQLFERLQRTFAPHPKLRFFTKTFHNATGDIGRNGKPAGQTYHLCPYPWTMLQIASNGNVVPCCRDLRQKTVLGNLMRDELSDIWNGEEFRKLRRHLVDEEPDKIAACVGCDL